MSLKEKELANPFNKYRRWSYAEMLKELAASNNVDVESVAAWFKRISVRKLTMPPNVEIMKKHGVDILQELNPVNGKNAGIPS